MLKFNPEIEPHEVLLDKLAKKREEEIGISEKKLETPIFRGNLFLFFSFLFFLVLILFFRTFYLIAIKGKEFSAQAQSNKYILAKIQAERGIIYDRNLTQLVFNIPQFNLVLEKEKLPTQEREKKKILKEISQILKIDFQKLEKEIRSEPSKIKIAENLDHQTLVILEAKIENLPGFEIESSFDRKYLDGETFSHLIGYLGKIEFDEFKAETDFYSISDLVGKEGIEKSYEKILRKNPGKILIERNAKGNIISQEIVSLPDSGKSLVLWLDSNLQKKIKDEMEKKIKEVGAKGGAAVAMDPKTGGILAMISLPSFDNNLFSQEISKEDWEKLQKDPKNPFLNRATSGQYLLGSTIKPFIAIAALEEKIISPQRKINCEGKIEIPHQYNPEIVYTFGDWTVHGLTDIRKAIAESCNVFFYTIGGGYKDQKGLGPTKIKKYLEIFGFGKIPETDFPIPLFAQGILPDPQWKKEKIGESWWDGDTYNLSIGQGYILATPIQVAKAFTAIANGGKLMKPKFVWKIIDNEKNTIEEFRPEVIKEDFIDPKNIEIVREGMRWAVTGQNSPHASAIALKDLPVSAAAKTGTAQVFKKGCQDCYNIWIATFAPYENPEILLVIVLEDVPGRLSQVVVPVAKEILNWYFSR